MKEIKSTDIDNRIDFPEIESISDERKAQMFDQLLSWEGDHSEKFVRDFLNAADASNEEAEELFGIDLEDNTVFNYLYRDGSNYKQRNRFVLKGRITGEQEAKIFDALSEGTYFIPEQIGLPIRRPSDTLNEDDHCWCEVFEDEAFEETEEDDDGMTAEELVKAFEKAAETGWDDVTYAVAV